MGQAAAPNISDDPALQTARWEKFIEQWESASLQGEVIVIGDTNLDELKWATPDYTHLEMVNLVKYRIETLGYIQLIKGATRFWPHQDSSLIDKCWVNCQEKIVTSENINYGATDHNIIEIVLKIKGKITTPVELQTRSWKNWDSEKFKNRISNIDWTVLYQQNDISVANHHFVTEILSILNEEAPLSTIQIKNDEKKWISNDSKDKMLIRDQARVTASTTQDPEDWKCYRKLRNACTSSLRADRKADARKHFTKFEKVNDVSQLYKMTKRRLGWENGGTPTSFLKDGKQITSPKLMANLQMDFFLEKNKKLNEELPITNGDPHTILKKALERWGDKALKREEFIIREITLLETADLVKKLGNTKSFGHDTLDALTLKIAISTLLKPLNYLINLSIKSSKFANQWRIAKLIPLYKGKGLVKVTPSSYRPIAILPVVSKIAERAVQNQLVTFMLDTGQLNINHNAYLQNRSTTTTILQLLDQIYQATDDNLISTLMTIDESNAFESVDHDLLLEKMKLYNVSESALRWFEDYLRSRTSYVMINAKQSKMVPNHQGVPQGSVLGPLLYTIFVNELPEITKEDDCSNYTHENTDTLFGINCEICGTIPCYADDATIIHSSKSRATNQQKLSRHLEKTTTFLNNNRLNLNREKTTISEIMSQQKRTRTIGSPPKLIVKDKNNLDKEITSMDYTRLLGCNISIDLRWSHHLESGEKALLPRLRKQLGAIKLLSWELPKKSKLLLSNGLLISKICYMVQIWGAAQKNSIRKVQVLMNQAARFIMGADRRTRTSKLMASCNWLSARELIVYHSLVSMWRVIALGIPAQINEHIAITEDRFLSTRPARLKIVKKSFKHRTIPCWNTLPEDIRLTNSILKFKRTTKRWLIDQRPAQPG